MASTIFAPIPRAKPRPLAETDPALDQLLATYRDFITEPGRHCQGAGARRADGTSCPAESPEAVAFCAIVALSLTAKRLVADENEQVSVWFLAYERLNDAADRLYGHPLITVNEREGLAGVLWCVDRARGAA